MFNPNKYKVMLMARYGNRPGCYDHTGGNKFLESVRATLELTIHKNLSTEIHVRRIIKEANCISTDVISSSWTQWHDEEDINDVQYTWPKLECVWPVWCTHFRKKTKKCWRRSNIIISLLVSELSEMNFDERREVLDLLTLEERKMKGDFMSTFRFLKCYHDVDIDQSFGIRSNKRPGSRVRKCRRSGSRIRKNVKKLFIIRFLNMWKKLRKRMLVIKGIFKSMTEMLG